MNRFCASFSTLRSSASGTTSQPRRQPVMPKYFEKLFTTTASASQASAVQVSAP